MAEEKIQETGPAGFTLADYSPAIQAEIRNLLNIEKFLRRVKDIEGDEAFAYVDVRKYLANKAAMLKVSEEARLTGVAKVKEQVAQLVEPVEAKSEAEELKEAVTA